LTGSSVLLAIALLGIALLAIALLPAAGLIVERRRPTGRPASEPVPAYARN
jgi:hypothetical protein